jgi:hypothetical protein
LLVQTNDDDYVVEFFLPSQCVKHSEQQDVLSAISATMARNCRTLRTLRPDEVDPDMLDDSEEEDDDDDLGKGFRALGL